MAKTLAIGVTIGLRKNKQHVYQYFQESIASLRAAGFKQPVVAFVEPGAEIHLPALDQFNIKPVQRAEKLGCFQNFRHGLQHLMQHEPADWYLMLQDDCVWRADSALVLGALLNDPAMQTVGMLSPYTSKAMVPFKEKKRDERGKPGDRVASCSFYNKAFWGAVAMAFPHESAKALDAHPRYAEHAHTRKLDVVVGNTLRVELKLDIKICLPSLCDHIGAISTLGRHKLKSNQWGRHGYLWRER